MGAELHTDDLAALRRLVEAYSFAVDRRDSDRFVDLFSEDAVLTVHDVNGTINGSYIGRPELHDLPKRMVRYERTLHLVHNHEVQVDGDEASGEVYCTAHHVSRAGADAFDRVLTIRYIDRYRREPDRWRIRSREVRVEWIEDRPVER